MKTSAARARRSAQPLPGADRLVGGVNSPVRAFRRVGGDPVIASRANGATIWDASGRAYVDFIQGWGALLLGHAHPRVTRAAQDALRRGALYGLTAAGEPALARLICDAVPSVEQIRFTVSGTEACMTAIKLARAHTGRDRVLMCAGGYHGHSETAMAGESAGIPQALAALVTRIPFNDRAALEAALSREGRDLAAVLIEPVPANMGVIIPERGYLQHLRTRTRELGITLIFDEVVTGFRLAFGGAQEHFGVQADLTTFGKIIGGGMPIGAVGGRRAIMQRLAPEGDVYHAGTFAGHPVAMAAGAATLAWLASHRPYAALADAGEALAAELRAGAREAGVPVHVNQLGSMFTVFFSRQPVRTYSDVRACDAGRFGAWARALRAQRILMPPSPHEAAFLSLAHTPRVMRRIAPAWRRAFREANAAR